MDAEFEQEVDTSTVANTPTSTIPSVASDASGPNSTLNSTQSFKADTLELKFAPTMSVKEQIEGGFNSAHFRYHQGNTGVGNVDQVGDFPLEHSQEAPRKQASITHGGSDTVSFAQSLQSLQSGAPSIVPSNESHGLCEAHLHQQGHHRARNLDIPGVSTHFVDQIHQSAGLGGMSFSGSSSGLAGLPQDYSLRATRQPWIARQRNVKDPMLTEVVDAGDSSQSCGADGSSPFSNDPFGTRLTECSFGSGFHGYSWDDPSQTFLPQNQHAFEAEIQQRYSTYLPSGFNTLSLDP